MYFNVSTSVSIITEVQCWQRIGGLGRSLDFFAAGGD